jgi:excisionase family DNA binding protein
MAETEYLTSQEVAAILKVSPRAVQNWVREGRLGAYRPFGRWRITREQLDTFVQTPPPGREQYQAEKPSGPGLQQKQVDALESIPVPTREEVLSPPVVKPAPPSSAGGSPMKRAQARQKNRR